MAAHRVVAVVVVVLHILVLSRVPVKASLTPEEVESIQTESRRLWEEFRPALLQKWREEHAADGAETLLQTGAQFIPDFNNPNYPDYTNPIITPVKDFFGMMQNPPSSGACDCGLCRAILTIKIEPNNCVESYKLARRPESMDQQLKECKLLEQQLLLQLAPIHHVVSWYLCSCLGCCSGDCFLRRRFLGPDDSWTRVNPIEPVGICSNGAQDGLQAVDVDALRLWQCDRCVGMKASSVGRFRTVGIVPSQDPCNAPSMTAAEQYECFWLHSAIANQIETRTDRWNWADVQSWGLEDYGAYYICTCVGCDCPSVQCFWWGPIYKQDYDAYALEEVPDMPPPLRPKQGDSVLTDDDKREHDKAVYAALVHAAQQKAQTLVG
eukprot:TRINITY_DN40629_c0_g1_i1.p2 TRINITY_DN40629_c0_g1~~TRINITY_DN40629_c0_g1_i1.p2  ORF type:complete len:387 (+),score=78.00 TRINITY_DN40629_c0_g1_i1:22-1161(+)